MTTNNQIEPMKDEIVLPEMDEAKIMRDGSFRAEREIRLQREEQLKTALAQRERDKMHMACGEEHMRKVGARVLEALSGAGFCTPAEGYGIKRRIPMYEAGRAFTEQEMINQKQQAADVSQASGIGSVGCLKQAVREPLVSRLRSRNYQAERDSQERGRAIMILEQHPEFEDFIWLLRSGFVD